MQSKFATLEARLRGFLDEEQLYGITDTTRAGKAQVIHASNQLMSGKGLGASFTELCRQFRMCRTMQISPAQSDPFTAYEIGIERLLEQLGDDSPQASDLHVFQQRLMENIASARQYGDTEILRHERARITDQINALARAVGGPLLPAPRSAPRITTTEQRNRARMLQKVRDFWIRSVLENSLHNEVLIALTMEERPDAVQHPWDMVIQQPDQPACTIRSGTRIIDVFDQFGGELLILGAPGSGKTTMLLELARDLIGRAEQDESYPTPVIFNLSSWAETRKSLVEWLVDELNTKYDVPRRIGKAWIEVERVLPLLDGLDEVNQEHRQTCALAINIFRRNHGLVNLVVCSRLADYEGLTERLKLQGAVLIHPLTLEQIDAYLASAGDQLITLRAALREDDVLRELAQAPLMLSVMTLAYQGVKTEGLVRGGLVEDQRKQLFDTYVERMFSRRSGDSYYLQHQVVGWLTWLSRAMIKQAESIFFIERLQPNMLSTDAQSWWYTIVDRLGGALILGVLVGMIINWRYIPFYNVMTVYRWLQDGINFGLGVALAVGFFGAERELHAHYSRGMRTARNAVLGGLIGGLVNGLVIGVTTGLVVASSPDRAILSQVGLTWFNLGLLNAAQGVLIGALAGLLAGGINGELSIRPRRIVVVETLRWSKSKALKSALNVGLASVLGFFIVVIAFNILNNLSADQWPLPLALYSSDGWLAALIGALFCGCIGGLGFALIGGITSGEVETKIHANQGIWRSARNATVIALSIGIGVGAIVTIANILLNTNLEDALYSGLNFGLSSGTIIGMAFGGRACLSHVVLRLVLWRNGAIPWNYARFLDYCAERIFLRKVGGGYIFVHRSLMEYFASLDTAQPQEERSPQPD